MSLPVILRPPAEVDIRESRATYEAIRAGGFSRPLGIRWDDVNRIWYVTTSDGPRLPDQWILLEGEKPR